jgi:predicted nucleotidyltransferase
MMKAKITFDQKQLEQFCRKNHIRRLSLFGSVLREDFRPESDVDVLVEFAAGFVPGFGFFGLQDELSKIFSRKVDLHTPAFLSKYFRQQVLNESHLQYAA